MENKWRVLLLDTKKSNPNHYICIAIKNAFENSGSTERVFSANYGNAIEVAKINNCNLFIAFDGEELERGLCSRLAQICGTSVLWITEDPYELSVNIKNAEFFDLVFTNDSSSTLQYGAKGRHLPFAASMRLHHHDVVENDSRYLYDVFFAGTAWPNRVSFLKELQPQLSGLKLKLLLPHNPHIPLPDLALPRSTYMWKTPNSEFAKFSNRSKIVLTLHRSFSSSGNKESAETPGPRLFEVALAGGFQLIDTSLSEINHYFREGVEYSGFKTTKECVEKLHHYLQNPSERIEIAKSAQKRAMENHLYQNRISIIYSELSKLVSPPKEPPQTQKPRILFVTHNVQGVQPYGGVEVYQHAIIEALKNQYEFFVYCADRTATPYGKEYSLFDSAMRKIKRYSFHSAFSDAMLSCVERERKFSEILSENKIDIVHFQHLIGHPPSLPFIAKSLGVASIASLHDYYAICKHFNLIGYHGRFCRISELPPETCDACLNAQDSAAPGSQAVRRAFYSRALDQIDMLHANTAGVADYFKAIYPNLQKKDKIRIKGIPIPDNGTLATHPLKDKISTPISVAIVGNFTKNKGADTLIHALNQLRDDDLQFHIYGSVIEPYKTILNTIALPNVEIHGEYEAGSIVPLLQSISLSIHLSIWPETYCITLSEAWLAGVVPIVSDIGALGERVIDKKNGFKIPPDEPGSLISLLRRLSKNPSKIEEIRRNISSQDFILVSEHALWLMATYNELLSKKTFIYPSKEMLEISSLSLNDCCVFPSENIWLRPHKSSDIHHVGAQLAGTLSLRDRISIYRRMHGNIKTVFKIVSAAKKIVFKIG